MNRRDPRIRQTLDRLADTLDAANVTTQATLWSFTQSYINPCLESVNTCLESSCYPCFGASRDHLRARNRGRETRRGRPELVFEFYNDDWDEIEADESTGLLGSWSNDELDRILAGSGDQPTGHKQMSYGSRGVRRKSVGALKDGDADPTVVPSSSMFGFLESLPWKIGGHGKRYKPSTSDLQENPGKSGNSSKTANNSEAIVEESENEAEQVTRSHTRKRSGTANSKSTTNSLSSRGDLFPSEDEDDAVPLDDEFSMALERRTTNQESEDANSGKSKKSRPTRSRTLSSKTTSSKSSRVKKRVTTPDNGTADFDEDAQPVLLPAMEELPREEARVIGEGNFPIPEQNGNEAATIPKTLVDDQVQQSVVSAPAEEKMSSVSVIDDPADARNTHSSHAQSEAKQGMPP